MKELDAFKQFTNSHPEIPQEYITHMFEVMKDDKNKPKSVTEEQLLTIMTNIGNYAAMLRLAKIDEGTIQKQCQQMLSNGYETKEGTKLAKTNNHWRSSVVSVQAAAEVLPKLSMTLNVLQTKDLTVTTALNNSASNITSIEQQTKPLQPTEVQPLEYQLEVGRSVYINSSRP